MNTINPHESALPSPFGEGLRERRENGEAGKMERCEKWRGDNIRLVLIFWIKYHKLLSSC